MPSQFDHQLGSDDLADPVDLPLAHTTTFEISRQILECGQFDIPHPCPIYGEKLLYTFVARPIYRFADAPDPVFGLAFAPVCFLIKASCANDAVRALPFDSGGFERYRVQMHPAWQRAEFELDPPPQRAEQVVSYFWSDRASYYAGKPRTGMTIPPMKTLLQQYYTLITNGIAHGFDARCSTIEVQLPSPTGLAGNLVAVFAPLRATDDSDYQALVAKWGGDLVGYRFHEPFYSNDYFTSIFDAVELYLKREPLL